MNRQKFDVAFTSLLIGMAIVILTSNTLVEGGVETEFGSMFLPRVVAVLIILFSVAMGLPSLLKLLKGATPAEHERVDTTGFLGIGLYLLILFAYWFAMPYIGFLIATPLAMFSIALLLGGRNWVAMVALSVITTLIVYYGGSTFLRVFLPTWSLS